jgi:hypothetical protein
MIFSGWSHSHLASARCVAPRKDPETVLNGFPLLTHLITRLKPGVNETDLLIQR